jgi:TadE-like protein
MRFQTEKPIERRCWFSEKGQSAVEFGMVLPVLALMLFVIGDFGRIFFVSVAVDNAARAGAQYGSQTNTTAFDSDGIQTEAANDFGCVPKDKQHPCPNLPNWNTPSVSQCTCGTPNLPTDPPCPTSTSAPYCTDAASSAVFVTVNTSATFSTILTYPFLPNSFTLTGQAIMQVQEN